jgi:hypothetical protein
MHSKRVAPACEVTTTRDLRYGARPGHSLIDHRIRLRIQCIRCLSATKLLDPLDFLMNVTPDDITYRQPTFPPRVWPATDSNTECFRPSCLHFTSHSVPTHKVIIPPQNMTAKFTTHSPYKNRTILLPLFSLPFYTLPCNTLPQPTIPITQNSNSPRKLSTFISWPTRSPKSLLPIRLNTRRSVSYKFVLWF